MANFFGPGPNSDKSERFGLGLTQTGLMKNADPDSIFQTRIHAGPVAGSAELELQEPGLALQY